MAQKVNREAAGADPKDFVTKLWQGNKQPIRWKTVASPDVFDGELLLQGDELSSVRKALVRYGDMCRMTTMGWLPVGRDRDITTTQDNIPTPAALPTWPGREDRPAAPGKGGDGNGPPQAKKPRTDAGNGKAQGDTAAKKDQKRGSSETDRLLALSEESFLKPHPTQDDKVPPFPSVYPWPDTGLGFLEPDSPVVAGGYRVVQFLFGAAGIMDNMTPKAAEAAKRTGKPPGPRSARFLGYVAASPALREVVIVFRGTQLGDEWAQNADFRSFRTRKASAQLLKSKLLESTVTNLLSDPKFRGAEVLQTLRDTQKRVADTAAAAAAKPKRQLSQEDQLALPTMADAALSHKGFYEAYYCSAPEYPGSQTIVKPMSEQVYEALAKLAGLQDELAASAPPGSSTPPKWQAVTLTGHSLGGALATVCGFDLMFTAEFLPSEVDGLFEGGLRKCLQGVTWAAPRVGNDAWQAAFTATMEPEVVEKGTEKRVVATKWCRLTTEADIVPMVPWSVIDTVADAADGAMEEWLFGRGTPLPWGVAQRLPGAWIRATLDTAFDKKVFYLLENADEFTANGGDADYYHAGWEVRFDPEKPYVMIDADYTLPNEGEDGVAGVKKFIKEQVLNKPGQGSAGGRQDPGVLARVAREWGVRHNLDLYILLVEPSLDVARLNITWDMLRWEGLTPQQQADMGSLVPPQWWLAYAHYGVKLVKSEVGGKVLYRWRYEPGTAAITE